jgi:glycosyltransferase involved in cell wall biosynthesis
MNGSDEPKVLALIPCFNEEATIASLVLKTKKYVDTVLVVDDGSRDDTVEMAQEAGATVVAHEKNRGKAAAIKTGFIYALDHKYDYVITLDGDGQHNPEEIPLLLNKMIDGKVDIAIGIRFGNSTEMPWWRKIGKRVLDYATSFGSGGFVTDSQSGFRGFNTRALEKITPRLSGDEFSIESEQLIRAHDYGLSVGNARISCRYNGLGRTSTKGSASHGFSVLSYVIWLVAEKRPLLFIGVPGFFFVLLGLILGIYTLQHYNQTQVFVIPYAIVVSIFIILGALAMFIGLMLNVLPSIIRRSRSEI